MSPSIQDAFDSQQVNNPNEVFENLPPQLGHNKILELFKGFTYYSGRTILNSGLLSTLNHKGILKPYREVNKNGSFFNHEMIIKLLRILTEIKKQRTAKENVVINYTYISLNVMKVPTQLERKRLKAEIERLILLSGINFSANVDPDETEDVEAITDEDLEA